MASEVGADGIQVYATRGDTAPENLSRSGRQGFLQYVQSHDLTISALCGDYGGGGFVDPDGLDQRIEGTKRVFDLARDLNVSFVTSHIGVVPMRGIRNRGTIWWQSFGRWPNTGRVWDAASLRRPDPRMGRTFGIF